MAAAGSAAGLGALEWMDRQAWLSSGRRLANVVRTTKEMHVGFTDGWVSMPQGAEAIPPFWPDFGAPRPFNTYVFGIRDLTLLTEAQRADQRGHAQINAPILFADENQDFRIHLHNLGEVQRPVGQPDNHTIHFHGFPNQIVYFDGVPDNSLAATPGRELIYRYIPEDAGTYMYHCHVDDVEHVHMGLTGLVFVRPALLQLGGAKDVLRPRVTAALAHPIRPDAVRPEYQRATLTWENDRFVARTTGLQSSSRLMSIVGANALLELEPSSETLPKGTMVKALLLANL